MSQNSVSTKVVKGAVAGLVGGLVASWVMSEFQQVWSKAGEALSGQNGKSQKKSQGEDATVKTAEAIAEPVLGRPLNKDEKKSAGPIVHYAFGGLMGAAYGAANEVMPVSRKWFGLPYGAALFVGADEVAVPAFGLSGPPQDAPASSHLYGLVSHLVYAASLETVRRNVRRRL
jgi:putative membrane protein